MTDFTEPLCELLSLQSNCTENCSLSTWKLSVQVTDGANGTGIDRVSLRQGNGTMNTSLAAGNKNITLVSYTASCCSPDVELLIVDGVGNVGTCSYSVRQTSTSSSQAPSQAPSQTPTAAPVGSFSTKAVQSFLLCIVITIIGLNLPFEMGIN